MNNAASPPVRSRPAIRGAVAGLAGGVAWFIGLLLFFGPAQLILANAEFQSEKMLSAFTEEPAPRIEEMPWVLIIALLLIGVMWGWVYVWLTQSGGLWHDRSWWKRGLRFGVVSWALMVPWFLFYLPWNVLLEPTPLVVLESVCWAGVMLTVGVTIAGIDNLLRPSRGG